MKGPTGSTSLLDSVEIIKSKGGWKVMGWRLGPEEEYRMHICYWKLPPAASHEDRWAKCYLGRATWL